MPGELTTAALARGIGLVQGGGVPVPPGPETIPNLVGLYDVSDITTLYQDVLMTVPVSVPGQSVALIRDKSGLNRHLFQGEGNRRPIYQVEDGRPYLLFDGIDDYLVTQAAITWGSDEATVALAFRKLSDATQQFLYFADGGLMQLRANVTAGANAYYSRLAASGSGSLSNIQGPSDTPAPRSDVLLQRGDVSIPAHSLRTSGVSSGAAASPQGSGNYCQSSVLNVGSVNASSGFANGRIYAVALYNKNISDSEAIKLEAWLRYRLTGVIQ